MKSKPLYKKGEIVWFYLAGTALRCAIVLQRVGKTYTLELEGNFRCKVAEQDILCVHGQSGD